MSVRGRWKNPKVGWIRVRYPRGLENMMLRLGASQVHRIQALAPRLGQYNGAGAPLARPSASQYWGLLGARHLPGSRSFSAETCGPSLGAEMSSALGSFPAQWGAPGICLVPAALCWHPDYLGPLWAVSMGARKALPWLSFPLALHWQVKNSTCSTQACQEMLGGGVAATSSRLWGG